MAGALWGYYLTYLSPVIFLSILVGAKFVLMTILGGRGTVSGPVVGAVVFIVVTSSSWRSSARPSSTSSPPGCC